MVRKFLDSDSIYRLTEKSSNRVVRELSGSHARGKEWTLGGPNAFRSQRRVIGVAPAFYATAKLPGLMPPALVRAFGAVHSPRIGPVPIGIIGHSGRECRGFAR